MHEVVGRSCVALGAARAMHDCCDPTDRCLEAVLRDEVADHELDPCSGLAALPAQDSYVATSFAQATDDESSERTGAPGDQDRCHNLQFR